MQLKWQPRISRGHFLLECLSELSNESNQPITNYALLRRGCYHVMTNFDLVARATAPEKNNLEDHKRKNLGGNNKKRKKIFARKSK